MRRFATNTYLIIILLFCSGNVIAKTYYVSSHGINTAIGTSPDHPWQTIQFAMGKMVAGDSCLVMEGVYRETVKLMNSGRENAPITLMPYHDQNVFVTGLDSLSGWRKAEGKNYWQADMTWTLGRGNNQLFYDGEVMLEARFPNVPIKGWKFR